MKLKSIPISFVIFLLTLSSIAAGAAKGGAEYTGQFDTVLVPNVEDTERVIFKFTSADKLKGKISFPEDAHFAAGRLMDPQTQDYSVLSLLVEEDGENPILFADTNGDNSLTDDEKYDLKRAKSDSPYLWNTTVELRMKDGPFKTCPIFVQYYKSYKTAKMGPEDRLVMQSTDVLTRGRVEVKSKKILVQYTYNFQKKKVDPQNGWLGVDADENGDVDMDNLSPEAAKADEETIIFRVGNLYVSTKKADVSKNQIILREHDSKDYKRSELYLGKEFPDFTFTDFDGKKRKFSEYRGTYVLLDIWGFWCPACRDELPYIREAKRRYLARNLAVVGLNTDPDFSVDSMKKALNDNGMNWTHAQFTSIVDFLRINLRVNSFPTTFLISPDGKILSMSRSERDEPDLRGKDLLDTLDEILPSL